MLTVSGYGGRPAFTPNFSDAPGEGSAAPKGAAGGAKAKPTIVQHPHVISVTTITHESSTESPSSSSKPVTSKMTPPTFELANTQMPSLSEQEKEKRKKLMAEVRGFEKKDNLKHCETDDRSAPLIGGRGNASSNPMAMGRAALKSTRGHPMGRGRGGPGRGGGALGDLFAGGFVPNPGALRGGRGGAPRQ